MNNLAATWSLAWRFALSFFVLTLPWPGLRQGFAAVVQAELRAGLGLILLEKIEVRPAAVDPSRPSADTEILLTAAGASGSNQAPAPRRILLDSRSLGWMPHAMILALGAAAPLGWKRRWKILASGVLLTHALVLATFAVCVLAGLAAPGDRLFWIYMGANHVLVDNLWMSFVGPLCLWLFCLWLFKAPFLADADSTAAGSRQ